MGNLFKNCFGHEVKIQLVRETAPVKEYQITKPYDVYVLVKEELETLDREVFLVITLNASPRGVQICDPDECFMRYPRTQSPIW
jgi:hypothetical protein